MAFVHTYYLYSLPFKLFGPFYQGSRALGPLAGYPFYLLHVLSAHLPSRMLMFV